MLRNTIVSLSDATAAFATTKATVALSESFLAEVKLTQNRPAMFVLLDVVGFSALRGRERAHRGRAPARRVHFVCLKVSLRVQPVFSGLTAPSISTSAFGSALIAPIF